MRTLRTAALAFVLLCVGQAVLAQVPKNAKTKKATAPQTEQPGYEISVTIDGFEGTELYLANYFLDKQYIVDTAKYVDGKAIFKDTSRLKEGMYLLVIPPDNDYAQLLIDADQRFTANTQRDELTTAMRIEGSEENERFFAYLQLLDRLRPQADSLRQIVNDSTRTQVDKDLAQDLVNTIDERVVTEQANIKSTAPKSVLASLLRSFEEPEMPVFAGSEAEVQRQQYNFYKDHYFDNIDLGDPRAIRSTYLDQKVNYYLEKLVVPTPDSINKEIDGLLARMAPSPETFRAYVSKFLNQYASSKVVGQDAVYAHLGEKYYMDASQTPWIDAETREKIADNVVRLKPLLIGQPAPELTTYQQDGSPLNLRDIEADYTVVFFFDPECGVCKKQTPTLVEFAQAYADQGVKVMSVCTRLGKEGDTCWPYVAEKEGMASAILNTNDPYHRSKFKISYDVSSTPQIYVFDRDKQIVSKRIAAEQLADVIDNLKKMNERPKLAE